jgi:type II secretory pathway component PulK
MSKVCIEPELIGVSVERRKLHRFLLRVPVIFRWNDEQAQRREGSGIARDISAAGVFVLTKVYPPPGATIELEVLLPPLRGAAQGLRLNAPGTVLRVIEAGEQQGFASTSDFAGIAAQAETGPLI